MRIALDVHMVGARETGNETYALQLSRALVSLGGYDYLLYTPRPSALPRDLRRAPGARARKFPGAPSLIRIPFIYPGLLKIDRASLLHVQYVAPPWTPCPVVVSVHDVSYKIYPQFFSPRVRLITNLLIGPSMKRAARVIVPSESTRRDVLRFYRLPPSRVAVVPLAPSPCLGPTPLGEVERVRSRYGLQGDYVLAVGTVQPRKNLRRLVEAFASVASEFPGLSLAIAGPGGWRGSEIESEVLRAGLGERVRFTGYVPEADLPALYTGASVFCYTSLYEGFGLPLLEAMACGAPTITSNTSSLPEVAGDAALQVTPTSTEETAAALRLMLGDNALRAEYARRGLQKAKHYTWELTARMTRNVYDTILGVRR